MSEIFVLDETITELNPPILTEDNWLLYAAKYYKNNQCASFSEFNDDLRRIKYTKKLCTRFETSGDLKIRLILNHITVLSNIFDPVPLNRILFLKMEPQFPIIKPFLLLLNILQEKIINVKETRVVLTDNIPMDQKIVNTLRSIIPKNLRG